MKIQPPWSTSIVDVLPIEEDEKMLLRFWIWCDRVLWIGTSIGTVCAIVVIFKLST